MAALEAERGRGRAFDRAGDPWPFGGRVVHSIELRDDELATRIAIETDGEPMPVIAGWHPWLVRRLVDAAGIPVGSELELDLQAGGMLQRGEDRLPTCAVTRPFPTGPWDDCFVGLTAEPVVRWAGFLEARVRSPAEFWVVYTEPADYICVEPQSGPPNGLNTGPFAVVTPDQPFELSMTIAWQRIG